MFNNVLEIATKATKGGRVPIKIALLKIHEDSKETNNNGIHWEENYVINALGSAKMMPICAEFCDETKSVPLGHGLTGIVVDATGIREPFFGNSETVGVIETSAVETVSINGVDTRVLTGSGYLYSHRYPNFVQWVRENYALNHVDTSVEIMGLKENNNKIVYAEGNPTEKFRTPKEFVFSGTSILALKPADENAIVLEVAQNKNKEETLDVDENKIIEVIKETITETNSIKAESDAKISELNNDLSEKEQTIVELNATVEQLQKALEDIKKEQETFWEEKEILTKELAELKVEKRLNELNETISVYSEDEKKLAEAEINAFKEDPLNGSIEEINSKICVGIIAKQKESEKVLEQNSMNNKKNEVIDIFSEINSDTEADDDTDINIF